MQHQAGAEASINTTIPVAIVAVNNHILGTKAQTGAMNHLGSLSHLMAELEPEPGFFPP